MDQEPVDFQETKQKKERGMTVKDILSNKLKQYSDIETVVVVSKHKDGVIETAFSWEGSTEALGMLTIAQADIVDYMKD
ncbi:hypothetical protein [Bavariicoccus seileri]|uniref:hypothetical protein n=1 Tax=Bavariicoccus seileri TaxID=549685 RepID=UPI0003B774CC|nr:hypothetical protein [Bavariicoccus seileri]